MMKQILWWLTWVVLCGYPALIPVATGIPLIGAEPGGSWRLSMYIVVPLIAAVGIRWLLLNRIGASVAGYALFLVGLVLVDMGGMMALFLRPAYRVELYVLCLAGGLQFFPLWLLRKSKSNGVP